MLSAMRVFRNSWEFRGGGLALDEWHGVGFRMHLQDEPLALRVRCRAPNSYHFLVLDFLYDHGIGYLK